eukprot:336351_1
MVRDLILIMTLLYLTASNHIQSSHNSYNFNYGITTNFGGKVTTNRRLIPRISRTGTPSPLLPDNYCRCEDHAFEVVYQSRRKNTARYGSNVWCFDYTVRRNPSALRCNDDAYKLDYVLISAETTYPQCKYITCA